MQAPGLGIVPHAFVRTAKNTITAVGTTREPQGNSIGLVRYLASGKVDIAFGSGGIVRTRIGSHASAHAALVQPEGKIVVAGCSSSWPSGDCGSEIVLLRYLPDGSLDPEFGTGGIALKTFAGGWPEAHALLRQPDGKIVVAGHLFENRAPRDLALLLRYHANGTLDQNFGRAGIVEEAAMRNANEVALQPGGRIVVAGYEGV